jgi:hypothetical protein
LGSFIHKKSPDSIPAARLQQIDDARRGCHVAKSFRFFALCFRWLLKNANAISCSTSLYGFGVKCSFAYNRIKENEPRNFYKWNFSRGLLGA